jgi:hypothetical protein
MGHRRGGDGWATCRAVTSHPSQMREGWEPRNAMLYAIRTGKKLDMKARILFATAVLLASAPTYSQTGTTSQPVVLCTEVSCPHMYSQGFLFVTARSTDLEVVAGGIVDTGHHIYVAVAVRNLAKTANIDVLPENFTLQSELGKKTRALAYVAPSAAVLGEANPSAWANVFDGIVAGTATQSSSVHTTGNASFSSSSSNGTLVNGTATTNSSSTVTNPDNESRKAARDRIAEREAIAEQQKRKIADAILRSNTVIPGNIIQGIVFFERDRKAEKFILSLPIAGTTYVFNLNLH